MAHEERRLEAHAALFPADYVQVSSSTEDLRELLIQAGPVELVVRRCAW